MFSTSKYIFLLPLLMLVGCKKFVQVDLPLDRVNSKTVFANDETAKLTMVGLYGSMIEASLAFSYRIAYTSGLYTDELDFKYTYIGTLALYQNKLIPQDAQTNTFWGKSYNFIYQSNSIIEKLEKASSINEALGKQLKGEALFFRAFWYYYLVNTYGAVPLILTTDFNVNKTMPATSVDSIYNQIEKDLVTAKSLLSEVYVDNSAVKPSTERIRINKLTASAFLARIYLYKNVWEKAAKSASELIDDPNYALAAVDKVFKRTSKEVIFQFENTGQKTNNYFNSYEAHYFTIIAAPGVDASFTRVFTLSDELLNKFSPNDRRRLHWVGAFKDMNVTPHVTYLYPSKYTSVSATLDEYSTPFRLAEQYLIRAEAKAQLNQLSEAIKDLDKIRERAGISLVEESNPTISKEDLLDLILEERQRELFCEYGHRFFDLKRTGKMDEVMKVVAIKKGSSWSPDFKLWPIPQSEVLANVYLDQNEGYK